MDVIWLKVRKKETGQERVITQKSYAALGPKVYEKLYVSDAEGNPIGPNSTPSQSQQQAQKSVEAAAPAVGEQKITIRQPIPVEIEKEAWTGEDEPTEQPAPKQRTKPGRKPKAISSPNEDAQ